MKDLMFAMKLPKKLAVIKVKAHLTTNTTEAKGNALADVAAKQACFYATVQVCSGSTAQKIILPPESIVDLYKDVPLYEAWTWLDKGATVDSSGCWTKGGKGERGKIQRTVNTAAKIIGAPLPSILDIFLTRCSSKAKSIVEDPTHPSHSLFQLLPSGRRYRSIRARSARLLNSFFPQAVRALNSHHTAPL